MSRTTKRVALPLSRWHCFVMSFFVRSDRSTTGPLGVVLGIAVATVVLTSTPSAVVAGGVGGDAIQIPGLEALAGGSNARAGSVSCAAVGE